MQDLTTLTEAADLPGIVARRYPESGAHPGRAGSIRASWRGDANPSGSLFRGRNGCWLFKDHANGEVLNAYQFLTTVVGFTTDQAVVEMGGHVTRRPPPRPQARRVGPAPELTVGRFAVADKPLEALAGRGFLRSDLERYGIIADASNPGDAIIPVRDASGTVVNHKRRHAKAAKSRYSWLHTGRGSPPWRSGPYGDARIERLFVIEGELNAMVAHSVLVENGLEEGSLVYGVGGAEQPLPATRDEVRGARVYLYTDDDEAGRKARDTWLAALRRMPFATITVIPPQEKDFCDIAGGDGRAALFGTLKVAMEAEPDTDARARVVSDYYTVQDMRESARRYISGEIAVPSGYQELDAYTMGYPESGIVLIGGLPSTGKSIYLRDVLFHQTTLGRRVMLFSPDQSAQSIYTLLASKLAGIPAWRLQKKAFTPRMLDAYGSPEGIVKHWGQTFDYVILELSERLRVSEESEVAEIKRQVRSALDEGFDFFGGDYIQIFEPEDSNGREIDGKAIKDLKKEVHKWGVPFLLAIQLAKSKFPPDRLDGIPQVSDIEGHGRYHQAAEQIYMLYNHEVYWHEYVRTDKPAPLDYAQDTGKVRVYVRKNKTGPIGAWRYLEWDKELVTFRTMGEGARAKKVSVMD